MKRVIEANQKKIIIAVQNPTFSDNLRKAIEKTEAKVIDTPLSVDFLFETLEKANQLKVHIDGIIISSTLAQKLQDERLELMADSLLTIRERFPHTQIVVLSNEDEGHPLLAEVVQMGIYNIFIRGKSNPTVKDFLDCIDRPKPFNEVSKLLKIDPSIRWRKDSTALKANTIIIQNKEEKVNVSSLGKKKESKEKQVVNKQIIKRELTFQITNNVERVVGVPIPRKIVLVGSAIRRVGSTFVAHTLAKSIANLGVPVSYIENPYGESYSYDRFIGHQVAKNYRSKYAQYTNRLKENQNSDWKIDELSLVVKHPEEGAYVEKQVDFEVFTKILLADKSSIVVVDIGTDWLKEPILDLYDISDHIYFVVEPDIINAQNIEESDDEVAAFFRKNVKQDYKTTIIANRFTKDILKNEVFQQLYQDQIKAVIPSIAANDMFTAQYEGKFLNGHKTYQKEIEKGMRPLLEDILPDEFLRKKEKEGGLLKGLFSKSVRVK